VTGTDRARRLSDLFQRALDVAPEQRTAWLDRECAGDEALRDEVAALLAADTGGVASELEQLVTDGASPGRPQPGDVIASRYRILHAIGEGGMGVVFAAEQLDPPRRVALKCIRPGWLDAAAQQRFRREAEALARLQHPGIAQVYEAGIAPGPPPLPFLAMELVEGTGLLQHTNALPPRARVERIAQIAEAVAHAHERGVVHRDLKPSNVMVETGSAGPRVRVLDFGVARFTGDDVTRHTRTHQLIGTLAYMSPEQLAHGSAAADARSDVWSLGVTAYEVLTGTLPLPLGGKNLAEAARVLRDDEPVRLDKLVPALRGDVATIVHKALAKDPARRYADAGELAADLRRCLADQPIAARPPSAIYQATRFAKRHRGLVAGLAIAFAAMAAGLVVAIVFAANEATAREQATRALQRATARTTELREMVRTLMLDVDRELAGVPGTTKARQVLLDTGRRHAAGMANDAGDDAVLLEEIATLHGVLAAVQGRAGDRSLGDTDGAIASLHEALALLDRAIAAEPAAVKPRTTRFRLLTNLDSLLRSQRRTEEREAVLDDQRRTADALEGSVTAAEVEELRARAEASRSRWLADQGRFADALGGMAALRDLLLRRGATAYDREDADHARAITLQLAGLRSRLAQHAEARAEFASAVEQARATHARHGDPNSARALAGVLRDAGYFHLQQQDTEAALAPLQEARELVAPLAAADRDDVEMQRLLRTVEFGVGHALGKLGRNDEAGPLLHEYLVGMKELAARFPTNRALQRELVPAYQNVALFESRVGRFDVAGALAAEGVQHAEGARREDPTGAQEADDLLMALGVVAQVAERAAGVDGLNVQEHARRRATATDALTAQLAFARKLDDEKLLEPRRRYLLDELPPRIAALRRP
jgi:tRNA A-37 threonylcarbamoyl transferase component Bud32/tetratricopeptide (TPR) repeat protein